MKTLSQVHQQDDERTTVVFDVCWQYKSSELHIPLHLSFLIRVSQCELHRVNVFVRRDLGKTNAAVRQIMLHSEQ